MNWYLKVWQQYADFTGRARRTEYWMFTLFNFIIVMLFYFLIFGILVTGNDSTMIVLIPTILLVIYAFAVLIPNLAVVVRRLHDIGKSGWWYFIGFIPLVGPIWLLVLLCTDSQYGSNEWGDNPKGEGSNIQDFEKL